MTFTIPGRLPSLNQTLKAGKWRFFQSRQRQIQKRNVGSHIIAANVPRYEVPVQISVRWVEVDRRRDYDNISSGIKVILDALVATQRIPNDGQKWVRPVRHDFAIDKNYPRIEITIEEAA